MTNVDLALISGSDFRNDNIGLLRNIGNDVVADIHPQLLELFAHYKEMFINGGSDRNQDVVIRNAAVFKVYQLFCDLYGYINIFRDSDRSTTASDVFFQEYVCKVHPLILSLSFNSIAYLYFCTGETSLVKRIIDRLKIISVKWQQYESEVHFSRPSEVIFPLKDRNVGVDHYLLKYVPANKADDKNSFLFCPDNILPPKLNARITDMCSAYWIFKTETNTYVSLPEGVNYSLYMKIRVSLCKNVGELINMLRRVDSSNFDLDFVFFSGYKLKCTQEELTKSIPIGSGAYHKPYMWLLLCHLYKTSKLVIDERPSAGFKWNDAGRASIGPAMFDYHAYGNKESLISFLNMFQFKRNRDFSRSFSAANVAKLLKKYRELGLAVDVKALKIKRGILVNLLSAGFGDLFVSDIS
jgi:hypothetical protein